MDEETVADYVYTHERITINELDAAAQLLADAADTRRLVVKYSQLGAHTEVVADLAVIAIIQKQIAEALQEGRLVVKPRKVTRARRSTGGES